MSKSHLLSQPPEKKKKKKKKKKNNKKPSIVSAIEFWSKVPEAQGS